MWLLLWLRYISLSPPLEWLYYSESMQTGENYDYHYCRFPSPMIDESEHRLRKTSARILELWAAYECARLLRCFLEFHLRANIDIPSEIHTANRIQQHKVSEPNVPFYSASTRLVLEINSNSLRLFEYLTSMPKMTSFCWYCSCSWAPFPDSMPPPCRLSRHASVTKANALIIGLGHRSLTVP